MIDDGNMDMGADPVWNLGCSQNFSFECCCVHLSISRQIRAYLAYDVGNYFIFCSFPFWRGSKVLRLDMRMLKKYTVKKEKEILIDARNATHH